MERKTSLINNSFYEELKEKWYEDTSHPIALLRSENAKRNPWILSKIQEFKARPCEILDIGCGAGFLTNALAKNGHRVTGIDSSQSSLDIACHYDQTQTVRYLKKDAFSLDFKKESFDVICAMDFLEHVESPQQIIKEIARFLKPEGLFFFHTFNRNFLSWLMVIKGVEWLVPNTPKNMHVYPLFIKPEELKEWMLEDKLKIKEIHGFSPRFCSVPFLKSLIKRKVDHCFEFQFTRSLLTGYVGISIKN